MSPCHPEIELNSSSFGPSPSKDLSQKRAKIEQNSSVLLNFDSILAQIVLKLCSNSAGSLAGCCSDFARLVLNFDSRWVSVFSGFGLVLCSIQSLFASVVGSHFSSFLAQVLLKL